MKRLTKITNRLTGSCRLYLLWFQVNNISFLCSSKNPYCSIHKQCWCNSKVWSVKSIVYHCSQFCDHLRECVVLIIPLQRDERTEREIDVLYRAGTIQFSCWLFRNTYTCTRFFYLLHGVCEEGGGGGGGLPPGTFCGCKGVLSNPVLTEAVIEDQF